MVEPRKSEIHRETAASAAYSTASFAETQDREIEEMPLNLQLMLAALMHLSLDLPDTFHNTLSKWSDGDILQLEAAGTHKYLEQLLLTNKTLGFHARLIPSLRENFQSIRLRCGASNPGQKLLCQFFRHTQAQSDSGYANRLTASHMLELLCPLRFSSLSQASHQEAKVNEPSQNGLLPNPYSSFIDQSKLSLFRECMAESLWRLQLWDVHDTAIFPPRTYTCHEILLDHFHRCRQAEFCPNTSILPRQICFNLLDLQSVKATCLFRQQLHSSLLERDQNVMLSAWKNDSLCLRHTPSFIHTFEPVLRLRQTLLESVHSEKHAQTASGLSALRSSYLKDLYLLENAQLFEEHGSCRIYPSRLIYLTMRWKSLLMQENSSPESPNARQLVDLITISKWATIRRLGEIGQSKRACYLATQLKQSLRNDLFFQTLDSGDHHFLSKKDMSTMFSSLGCWMFNEQMESLCTVEKDYFDLLFDESSARRLSADDLLESHLIYAQLLDTVTQNELDNSFSFETVTSDNLAKSTHQDYLRIKQELKLIGERGQNAQNAKTIEAIRHHFHLLEQSVVEAEGKDAVYRASLASLAAKAIKHYTLWLMQVHSKDHVFAQNAASRVLSLWFSWSTEASVESFLLTEALAHDQGSFHPAFVHHLRSFAYQLVARLDNAKKDTLFQQTLKTLLLTMVIFIPPFSPRKLCPDRALPFWQPVLDRATQKWFESSSILLRYNLYTIPQSQIQSAHELLSVASSRCQNLAIIIAAMNTFCEFFIDLAILRSNSKLPNDLSLLPDFPRLMSSAELLPPPCLCDQVARLSLSGLASVRPKDLKSYLTTDCGLSLIQHFDHNVRVCTKGNTRPKFLSLRSTAGTSHTYLLKGRDDLRQDAVMQQLFTLLNHMFLKSPSGRERDLQIRTYKVIPLSPVSGFIQVVSRTETLSDILCGSESRLGAHQLYRPSDFTPQEAHWKHYTARTWYRSPRSQESFKEHMIEAYTEICSKFRPVLGNVFMDVHPTTQSWYSAYQQYLMSLALNSIIGYLMGIGDRHPNNILLEIKTGELIHIDFGMAFEKGTELLIPEVVPFRMTPDIVSVLGPIGFSGFFTSVCELALDNLRSLVNVVLSVVEVFLYDPLYHWGLNPLKAAKQRPEAAELKDPDVRSKGDGTNLRAKVAMNQVRRKLLGKEPSPKELTGRRHDTPRNVSSLLRFLLEQATSPERLAMMFEGWSPWL